MANKKSFVLRLNEETYRALERWALDEFRSVNGQLEWLIHQELCKSGRIGNEAIEKSKLDKPKSK
jgi:hypothetical protein